MEKIHVEARQILNQFVKIGHGDLDTYKEVGLLAAKHEPDLLAHLIAWNAVKGEIRDSKVALPVLALRGESDGELFENAAAHLYQLSARDLLRAAKFHRSLPSVTSPGGAWVKNVVTTFLRKREANRKWWDSTALQHRATLKSLYALYHVKPAPFAQDILFDRNYHGVFATVSMLKHLSPADAAGAIITQKIPFLVAVGALGGLKGKKDLVLALLERMSGNELVTNTGMLTKAGVFEDPMLRAAYEAAVERSKKDKRMSSAKAERAAKAVSERVGGKKAAQKLSSVHQEKMESIAISGNWLVLGDMSGSMDGAIELARNVAATIAGLVKGNVHLVFFNTRPVGYDVTGKSLDEIKAMTSRIRANGGTSVGCGLWAAADAGIDVDGIVIVSDGGDNTRPNFIDAYPRYVEKRGNEPNVYLLHVPGERDVLSYGCERQGIPLTKYEIGRDFDYYSLPNLIKLLRPGRYTLLDEVMQTPLLKWDEVTK